MKKMQNDDMHMQAKKKAMDLLLHNDRTEEELRQKLYLKGFDDESIECAISYVKGFGYVNDVRYATRYVEIYQNRKSRRILMQELKKKGVSASVIELAFENWVSDLEALHYALGKKVKSKEELASCSYEQLQKIMSYLFRKGFSMQDIRNTLEDFTDIE